MASEFRRRTLLTWSVAGAGFYGLKHFIGPPKSLDDEATLEEGRRWHGHAVNAFAVSPDGKMIATASRPLSDRVTDESEGVVCWRVNDGLPRWKSNIAGGVEELASPFTALTFSPDGSLIGALSRQHRVVSIEVSGSAKVGSQPQSAIERSPRFFFSQNGSQLFIASTQEPGQLGKVVPARSDLSTGERMVLLDDRDAIPFRLDERGLHVFSGTRYLILPPEGAPIPVGDELPQPALEVVVTPSRKHVAALVEGAAVIFDVELGKQLVATSPSNALTFATESGVPLGLQREYPVWHAYSFASGASPAFSGTEGYEKISGALPVALSPDGARAVSVNEGGEVALQDSSSGRRKKVPLGQFKEATGVAFPARNRVVVFGPTVLAFVDPSTKRVINQYRFPRY